MAFNNSNIYLLSIETYNKHRFKNLSKVITMRNEKISAFNFGFCFISQIDPKVFTNILISQVASLQFDSLSTFSQKSKNEEISTSLEAIF